LENVNSYVDDLLLRYRSKGVLIDTNLLLMLLVGSYKPELLGAAGFKRVAQYTPEDLELLKRLLSWFTSAVTTPHVLTEVSNLAAQLAEPDRYNCFKQFGAVFNGFIELNLASMGVTKQESFPYLGLTDSVLTSQAEYFLVLSDDLRFIGRLQQTGRDALNFNHIRTATWT